MGLKEFYYRQEDKYFATLDKLESKGINFYKIIDPLEKNGISTFPIFLFFVFAIIGLIIFLLISHFSPMVSNQVNVAFYDERNYTIANTSIRLKIDGVSETHFTDDSGIINLKTLNKDKIYRIEIDDPNYIFTNDIDYYNLNPNEKHHKLNLEKIEYQQTKTISFKRETTRELVTTPINVNFACTNNNYDKDIVVTTGTVTLSDIPKNCGSLVATIIGKDIDEYDVLISDSTIGEILFKDQITYSSLSITVKDKDTGLTLPNVNVIVYDYATDQKIEEGNTNQNGLFITEDTVVGKNYFVIVSDPNALYAGITRLDYEIGLIPTVQIKQNMTNSIELKIKKEVLGFIEIRITDKTTGALLEGVDVKLSKQGKIIDTRQTDFLGKVKFPIKENTSYTATLDKRGYILETKPVSISSTVLDFSLKSQVDSENYSVHIYVTDNEMKPIEYATVKIWNAINNDIVKVVTTDISGKIIITNLDPNATYFAEAITGQYTGKSANFSVRDREIEDVFVLVNIGQGTYNLIVVDETLVPLSLPISVYDAETNKEFFDKKTTTNENGLAIINIRADKTVFFAIETNTGRIITKKYNVSAENILTETIVVPFKLSNSATLEFLGFYNNNGEIVTSIIPGQSQIAKFILNVDKKYSKVTAHIRTGEGDVCDNKTYSATDESIYIKKIDFAGNKMIGSLNYTPCFGEAGDLSNISIKNTKWVNLIIDNPEIGNYIIDAEIVVSDTALSNQSLYYRAEFQQGQTIVRNPIDEVLGTSTSSTNKQALYAYAKSIPVYTGDSINCDGSICYSFSFKERGATQIKRVNDKFSAKEGTDYKFNFRLSILRNINNASLVIKSNGQTINFNSFNITAAGNIPIIGTDFRDIELGRLLANDIVIGEIDLSVINDISDQLTIELLSDGSSIFEKTILFNLAPSKTLNIEFLPKMVIPYIPNNAIIQVTDDTNSPLSKASVFVKINSIPIIDGLTDNSGLFSFVIPATNVKDVIEITTRKQNYKTNTLKYVVSESIITTIPKTVEFNIDISENYSSTQDIILINNTVLPFSISSIKTNINSEYVKLTSSSQGMLFEPNSQIILDLTAKMTEAGLDLMTQKTIKGDLLITVYQNDLEKNWQVSIPVTIRITFGDAVDSTDCIIIEPEETEIRIIDNEQSYTLSITNDCQVDGIPIALNKIFIESDYKDTKKLGDYYVVVSGQEKKLNLEEKIQILNGLEAGKKATVKLIYKKNNNTKGGISNPIIKIISNRANVNGVDTITSNHYPKIIINNYLNCIETPATKILVPYCAQTSLYNNVYGMGMTPYSMFSQNYDPTQYAYQQTSLPSQGYFQSSIYAPNYAVNQFYENQNFPYNNYRENLYGYNNLQSLGTQTVCQSTQIQIKNSCFEDVELKLDSLFGVIVSPNEEIALKKGESKTIALQGGQILGEYNIDIYAKPADDVIDEYTFVKNLPVIVNRPLEILPENCIIIPKTKFDFTYTTDIQKLTVINNCYDAGFALTNLELLNPDDLVVDDIQYFFIGDVNSELRPKKTYRYEDGKRIEIMTVGVRRNPEISQKILKADNENLAKLVSNIRTNWFDIGQSINKTAIIGITYSSPRLQAGQIEEEISFVDNLQWLGYLEDDLTTDSNNNDRTGSDTESTGSQGSSGSTIENLGSRLDLDFSSKNTLNIDALTAIEFTEFALNDNSEAIGVLVRIKDEYLDDISDFFNNETDARVCFNAKISDLKKASPIAFSKLTTKSYINKKDSGRIQNGEVVAEIHFFEKGKNFKVCISRPLTPLNNSDAQFNKSVFREEADTSKEKIFTLLDPRFFILPDKSLYKVKFALSANLGTFGYFPKEEIPEYLIDSPKLEEGACLDPKGINKLGFTGIYHDSYGFDKLVFLWDSKDLKHNSCDLGYYCDQDQLRIALSKKLDLLSSNQYIELDGIKFLKEKNKIAKNENLLDKSPINKSLIENLLANNAIAENTNTKAQITTLRTIVSSIPEDLRKYTIIEIAIPVGTIEEQLPLNLTSESIEKYTTKMAGNKKINFENTSSIKSYQFNVDTFLKTTNNLVTEIDSLNEEENKMLGEYLRRFLNSMTLFYGDALNPIILNTKTYGDLTDKFNKTVFSGVSFLADSWAINIKSGITKISEPETYKVDLEITNPSKKIANFTFTKVDAGINEYSTNNYYRANILFTTPINAYYYSYGGVPFKKEERGERKQTEIINNYNNWEKVQDGYVLTLKANNNAVSSITFKDIRPLQIISNLANEYRIDYLVQEKHKTLKENMEWFLSTESEKLIKQKIQYTEKQTNSYLLLNYNNKLTTFKNTIFVFKNLQDKSKLEEQLKIYSRNELSFNLSPITLSTSSIQDNKTNGYGIPKNIISLSTSQNKINTNTDSFYNMIKEINNEKMCFNFNNGTFNIWINPGDKSIVEVNQNYQEKKTEPANTQTQSASQSTSPPQPAGSGSIEAPPVPQHSGSGNTQAPPVPQPTPTEPKTKVNLKIVDGSFEIKATGGIKGNTKVVGNYLEINFTENKISGVVLFSDGDMVTDVTIKSATATIDGTKIILKIEGNTKYGMLSVNVTTTGTITTATDEKIDGTYTIVPNQIAKINNDKLELNNIKFS